MLAAKPRKETLRCTTANLDARRNDASVTPRERARLSSILARLASPYEGERAAAGLLASAFVAKRGLAWADLTATLQPAAEASAALKEPSPRQERRRNGPWRRSGLNSHTASVGKDAD